LFFQSVQMENLMTQTTTTRRGFLKGATATAATLIAARTLFPSGAFAQSAGPEVTGAKLGFIALTDSSPLIIALEKGLFAKHGVPDVEVMKQASWGATRDNLVLGGAANGIDGAHILTPMPYLMSLGTVTGGTHVPMSIIARLNLDAQAISVSQAYKDAGVGLDSSPLKAIFAERKASGQEVNVAMTFPGGTHDMWLRYWLAAGGIDPTKEVSLITVPPPQMVANMKVGTMDAFCVGEIWKGHPEKALSLRNDFIEANPIATQAILMAVMEAAQWADATENKEELANILGKRSWFGIPAADVAGRLKGDINYGNGRVATATGLEMKFWKDHASYPFKSHDAWFLTENIRWGYLPGTTDITATVDQVNREDIWRGAAAALGIAAADIPEGTSRGPETFFDGKVFDPANPTAYLDSLAIKAMA
jgi:nitrate/nitrite transport system substrate-binding protein